MTDPFPEDRVTLIFRPVPGWRTPPAARLRKLLKLAIRSCGLKCLAIFPSPPEVDRTRPKDDGSSP